MKDKITQSSGNLYIDLGYKNAEEMEAKAVLAREIYRIVTRRKLSPVKAAKLFGISKTHLADLLEGRLREFPTDELLHFLKLLGQNIDINVSPSRSRRSGKISVHTTHCLPLAAKNR